MGTNFLQFGVSSQGENRAGLDPWANCPDIQRLRCLQADVEYFICAFGEKEAVELTRIDNPTANEINTKRIELALEDAFAYIVNTYSAASAAAKVLIQSSFRRTQATIARYYLDTLKPRAHVIEAYNTVIEQLATWSSQSSGQGNTKFDQAYRFYRDQPYSQGVNLVVSSHERKRIFTPSTLEPWVWGVSANNVNRYIRYEQQFASAEFQVGNVNKVSPTGTAMPEELQNINQLYDSLDSTLSVGNFAETKSESKRIPINPELLALNPNTDSPSTIVDEDIIDPNAPYNLTF